MQQIILFVTDKPIRKNLLIKIFKNHGDDSQLFFTDSAESGIKLIKKNNVKAMFVSEQLPDMDAYEFINKIKKMKILIPIILILEEHKETMVSESIKKGALDCVLRNTRSFYAYPFVLDRAIARYELEIERENREWLISQSQKMWVSVIDGIEDYILITDNESRIFRANKALSERFNKHPKDLIGMSLSGLFGDDNAQMLNEMSFDRISKTEEKTFGDQTYLISCFPLNYNDNEYSIYVLKNISEMQRLKEQLYHSYKLASLGLLISGIAHEINNPIAGIITYAEVLKMKTQDEKIHEGLQKILKGAERCKHIIENLLTFSRQKTPSRTLESVNDIIDRTIELRNYWLKKYSIEIIKKYGELPFTLIDSQQLQLVILNMILNAEQAIINSGNENGKIIFETIFEADKKKIIICISDNGHGIPQNIISKIFDPFFTTKPIGTGTGLGLSIAHGIISEHDGVIRVESRENEGTTFVIELPYEKHRKEDVKVIE